LEKAMSNLGASAATKQTAGPLRFLTSFRGSRQFRFLWISNLFFFGGTWTQTLILAWLVYETTDSKFLLALFSAVRLAPLLLGPFSGVISDRFDRVRLLITACLWGLCAVAAIATMASLGHTPYWALVLGGLAVGLAQSPSQPSRASLVLELVGRENLSNANALNSMAINMTQVVGPALGGAMISHFGAPAALWISTGWFGISLLALMPLRSLKSTRLAHQESAFAMLAGGFRTVLSNRLSAAVLSVTLAANILIWPVYQVFIPIFAKDVLGMGAGGLGWLLTCSGVGGLTGSIIIASLGDFRFKGGLFVFGTATWGVLWALFSQSETPALSFVLMGCIGLMSASFGVLQTTLLLMTTPPKMQGRALGMQELAIGIMPVSSLLLGGVAEEFGVSATTFVSALTLTAVMLALAARVPALIRYSGIYQSK
jgi:MFS family permease